VNDVYVGGFHDAYDGKQEVSVAYVVKSNVVNAVSTAYQYLDNKCRIKLNDEEFVGTPYMGRMTKNKYVFSIIFPKEENAEPDDPNALMRRLLVMSGLTNVSMELEVIEENRVKRIDSQFWEKIKKTLREMASYSGSPEEWEDYKGYIKSEYGVKFVVGPSMEAQDAEMFYDMALEYARTNQIPLRRNDPVLKDIENYLAACRRENKCCVCGKMVYDSAVYPVCQDHYEELVEHGKTAFEHKHKF